MCEESLGKEEVLRQGSSTLGPWNGTILWPVRNWAAEQEVTSTQASEMVPCPKMLGTAILRDSVTSHLGS